MTKIIFEEDNTIYNREFDIMHIRNISYSYNDKFDSTIEKLISELKIEIEKLVTEYNNIDNVIDVKAGAKGYRELKNKIEFKLRNIKSKKYDLFILYELKVIYAYKYFEIRLKKLLSQAYPNELISEIHRWDNLKKFLEKKGISVKNITNFKEVDELRNTNNNFKHSGNIVKDEIKNIPEFKSKEFLKYEDLEKFYDRVKTSPKAFLKSLSDTIIDDLYEFDDKKIDSIAFSIARRMEKEDALKFIKSFSKLYE